MRNRTYATYGRKHKNDITTYKLIQRKIREAKQKEIKEKCWEIDELQNMISLMYIRKLEM